MFLPINIQFISRYFTRVKWRRRDCGVVTMMDTHSAIVFVGEPVAGL